MTGKERIVKAFTHGGEPDRVPVEPGLDFDTLTAMFGLDYWEYRAQGRTELTSLIQWCDRLGFDLYYFAAGIPEPNPPASVQVSERQWETGDLRIVETNVQTTHGPIQQRRRYPKHNPEYSHEKFVKDARRDWPALREYLGEDWPVHPRYFEEYARAGDRGVVGVVVHSPIDWWQEYRHGDVERVIYDLCDERPLMEEIFEYYASKSFAYLERAAGLTPKPDFVMIHGSTCSASVMSPDLFRAFALPYIQRATALLRERGLVSLFHVCGRSREWLPMLVDTDLEVIDALECPPAGNVDLAEVKKKYGGRLCLKGNVSAVTMACGTRRQVREEVLRCLDAAAEGGGYVLAVGDSIGPKADLGNIQEMVAAALEHGGYS